MSVEKGQGRARVGAGFARAGNLIGDQIRVVAGKRGFQQARLRALWPEIAGPELAGICWPVKLTLARGPAGGLLTLAVSGAHGPQVQMMVPTLRDRINAAFGPGTVGRIQLTHGVVGFAEPQAPFRHSAPPPPPLGDIGEGLSSIGDDDLRRALETLARNVLSRTRQSQVTDPRP